MASTTWCGRRTTWPWSYLPRRREPDRDDPDADRDPARTGSGITSETDHHSGFPTSCASNLDDDACGRADQRFDARTLFLSLGVVSSLPVGYAKWDTSTGQGMSGGAHYVCPGDDCSIAELTGLQAAKMNDCWGTWPCANAWAVGPKVPAFAAYVENALDLIPEPLGCPALGMEEADFVAHKPAAPTTFTADRVSDSCDDPLDLAFPTSICQDVVVYRPPTALGS